MTEENLSETCEKLIIPNYYLLYTYIRENYVHSFEIIENNK